MLGRELKDNVLQCKVLHTPGHSPGSCCFLFEKENLLVSGDTLFRMSIGRTDLMGGDFNQITNSIKGNIYTLPDDTEVIPGHGDKTIIGEEKIHNMFIKESESVPCPTCSPLTLPSSL